MVAQNRARSVVISWMSAAVLVLCACGGDTAEVALPISIQPTSSLQLNGRVAAELPNPVSARVVDANGKSVPNIAVVWRVEAGFGSVQPSNSVTDRAGVATTRWVIGQVSGEQRLRAVIASDTVKSIVFIAEASAADPAFATLAPADFTIRVGSDVQMVLRVVDAYGNDVTSSGTLWSSSNASVAAVSSSGVVRGTGPGVAEIAAVVSGLRATAKVTVGAFGQTP